ncbi:protein FAM86D, partial [Asbolus verrucosus]
VNLNINTDVQEQIINNTTRSDLVLKYPININYQKTFLKRFIEYLEEQGSVIHDSLYEEYCRLVALPCNNVYFKHYSTEKSGKNIILKEDIHLISDGTTGLQTWQASLVLSEWILSNISHFNNKIIVELGSGIGLTGLAISLYCTPKTVYLTDCHPSVLTALCENIKINSGEICQKLGHVDLIIAADVIYDASIFNSLICAVNCFFKNCGADQFILSCTERNTETLSEFLLLI